MRWLHLAKDAIGLALSRGDNEHAAAEFATDATATARAFIEQGQAPPDEHSGDRARPGEQNVEPPWPDQRPQEAGAEPIGSPSAFDAFAERLAQETWEVQQEPDSPAAPEQEPDVPDYDGPDIG